MTVKYKKENIFALLDEKGIAYHFQEHRAIHTMKEAAEAGIKREGIILKNLFLKGKKGSQYFLISVPEDRLVNFRALEEALETKKLGFASAQRLEQFLGAEPGCVSPLGLLNDEERAVTAVFDKGLADSDIVGVHPNETTASVWLEFRYIKQLASEHGNQILFLDFPQKTER